MVQLEVDVSPEEKDIQTEYGETTVEVVECRWCNYEKQVDDIQYMSRHINEQPADFVTCTCGEYDVSATVPICSDCLTDSIMNGETPQWDESQTETVGTEFGDVEIETQMCDCCGERRLAEEIEEWGAGISKTSHDYSTCDGGNYSVESTYNVCTYCADSLFDKILKEFEFIQGNRLINIESTLKLGGVLTTAILLLIFGIIFVI